MRLSRRVVFIILGVIVWLFLGWRAAPYFSSSFSYPSINSYSLLLLALLFVPINWGIEAMKWHYLISKNSKGYFQAYKSVLSGMALGMLTPNRIGEPFARAYLVPNGNYLTSTAAALICSLTQQAVTLIVGLLGALTLSRQLNISDATLKPYILSGGVILAISLLLLTFWPVIFKWLKAHSFTKTVMQGIRSIENFTLKQVITVGLLSLLRYCVFLSQYLFIIYALGCKLPTHQVISAIACIFLVSSIIPSPTFVDVGIKISLAILFLGTSADNEKIAAITSASIWIINIALPAFIGSTILITTPKSDKQNLKTQ